MCVLQSFVSQSRKNFFFALVLNFVLFSTSGMAHAAQNPSTQIPTMYMSYVSSDGVFDASYDARGYLEGLFAVLSKYMKQKVVFSADGVNNYLNFSTNTSGQAHIIALLGKSPERMFQLKFSKNPIVSTEILLVANKDKKIFYNDSQAMANKSVSIYSNNSYAKMLLDTYLVQKNIRMKYKIYTDYGEYIASDADYHLINSFYFLDNKQTAVSIGKQELYFATAPKNAAYLQVLDMALEKAQAQDAPALKALYAKFVNKSTQFIMQEYGEAEKYQLENPRGVTQAGYYSTHTPIQYTNEQGQPVGLTIEVLKLFQQIHQTPTKLIPYTFGDNSPVQKFDMLFSIVGDRAVKEQYFYTSKKYAQLPMVFFKREKPFEKNEIPTFAMLDYSVLPHNTVKEAFPHWEMKVFNSFEEIFEAYEQGNIHAILLSSTEAEYVISQLGVLDNTLIPTSLELPLHFYLSKKYPPQALNVLNAFIDKLNPVDVEGAIIKAEGMVRSSGTIEDFLYKHRLGVIVGSFVLLLLIFSLYAALARHEKISLRSIIDTDVLTGLSSKVHAYAVMQRVLKKALPDEYMALCIDIDKFSLLNQVYGREKADAVLQHIAVVLSEQYSKEHKAECIARLRDDVFLVFIKKLPHMDDYAPEDCKLLATYGVKEILQSDYNISISIGAYIIDDTTLPIETIIDYCNVARYRGKCEHGISITVFTEGMKKKIDAEKRIIYRMEQALESEEFILNFQPKVDLQTSAICGAEVLVRWQPSNAEPIYPDDFINVFEDNAFIAKLDMYVFEKVCQFIAENKALYALPPLAVNLSGMSVLHDETPGQIRKLLRTYGVSSDEIEIEITESALVAESVDFLDAIESLRNLGLKIAIDDFGTGVSSLHRLSSLNVDEVKLDKAFLDEKLTKKKGIILVASMIAMLHRLDMKVVAEGVETERHVHLLRKMNCDTVQGYYFYKPLSMNDFTAHLHIPSISVPVHQTLMV